MNPRPPVSSQTRNNWIVVLVLSLSSLFTVLSSVYFLFLPRGGYQGGRNPYYRISVLFTRNSWDLIHTWAGIILIALVAIHIPLHWAWIKTTTKRIVNIMLGRHHGMNSRGKLNLLINGIFGISGLLAAISGIYFLLVPSAHGIGSPGPELIFSHAIWDVIHTWSGTVAIAVAILHFAIHWRWVLKVAIKLLIQPLRNPESTIVERYSSS